MARNVSLRDTKNVIFKAYQELVNENKQLESQLKNKDKEISTLKKSGGSAPRVQVTTTKSSSTATSTATSIEGIIGVLKSIQDGLSKAISESSNKQMLEAEALADVQEKIETQESQIKALYDIDSSKASFEDLIAQYIEAERSFEENYDAKSKQYAEELAEKREAWKKEKAEKRAQLDERNKEAAKERKRNLDEYNYNLKQARAMADDEYAQKMKALKEELQAIKEEKAEAWATREKEVQGREEEFEKYKTEFEALDDQMSKAVKKAEAEGKSIMDRDHKVKERLYKADAEREQKALDLRIYSLKESIEKQQAQINKLTTNLDAAREQTRDLALKALEGSSNEKSFTAIREIAMEQAKNSGKGK